MIGDGIQIDEIIQKASDEDLRQMFAEGDAGRDRSIYPDDGTMVYAYLVRWWGPDISPWWCPGAPGRFWDRAVSEVRREAAVRSLFAPAPEPTS